MVAVSLMIKEPRQIAGGVIIRVLLQGMCEQGGMLTKGVLTDESQWSETFLCFHARAMPVIVRPTLKALGWQQKKTPVCDTGERLPVPRSMMKLSRIALQRPWPSNF